MTCVFTCMQFFYHPSIYLSIYLSTHLSSCLPTYLPIYLPICPSIYLSIHRSIYDVAKPTVKTAFTSALGLWISEALVGAEQKGSFSDYGPRLTRTLSLSTWREQQFQRMPSYPASESRTLSPSSSGPRKRIQSPPTHLAAFGA